MAFTAGDDDRRQGRAVGGQFFPADGVVGLQTWALSVDAAGEVLADICGVPGPG